MADLVDLLPQIPIVMKKKGWKTASALMQRWFDGPPSEDRDKQPTDTTDVTMDWVLSFQRAKTVYDKLVSDRIWMNKPAQAEIAHMLRSKMATITAPVPFGDLRNAISGIDKNYINERSVVSSPLGDPLDDLFGALGSFNFRVAVQGVLAPKHATGNPAPKPTVVAPTKPVVFEVTLKQAVSMSTTVTTFRMTTGTHSLLASGALTGKEASVSFQASAPMRSTTVRSATTGRASGMAGISGSTPTLR